MKAIVLESNFELVYKEVEKPVPAAGEALVSVKAVSICGSDLLRAFHGAAKKLPLIMGHECAGEIVEVGPGVPVDNIGRRVALAPLIPCMQCLACQHGVYSACSDYSFIGSRRSGGFAEFLAAPVQNLITLPEQVEYQVGAILEPATVALHAIMRSGSPEGKKIAIFGSGSIGLCIVQWARILGAAEIIASDVSEENRQRARSFGAHHCLNPLRDDVMGKVMEITGEGADIAFEVAGLPQTLDQAVDSLRPRGVVVCVGNLPGDATLPASLIERTIRKELDVRGTWMSYSAPFPGPEWTESMAALMRGELEMQAMISHCFPLSEISIFEKLAQNTFPHQKIILVP